MREAFIRKMVEAKKMELEAFQTLLPEDAQKHLDVIQHEVKEMGKDLLRQGLWEVEKMAMYNEGRTTSKTQSARDTQTEDGMEFEHTQQSTDSKANPRMEYEERKDQKKVRKVSIQ